MENSKDFLLHAPARVKQAVARAEKEEAGMIAKAADVEAGAPHSLDYSYDDGQSDL